MSGDSYGLDKDKVFGRRNVCDGGGIIEECGYEILNSADEILDPGTAGEYRAFGIRGKAAGERVKILRENLALGADKSCWVIEAVDLKFREFAFGILRTLNEAVTIGKYRTTIVL